MTPYIIEWKPKESANTFLTALTEQRKKKQLKKLRKMSVKLCLISSISAWKTSSQRKANKSKITEKH